MPDPKFAGNVIVGATAIIALSRIGQLGLLRKLYGRITVPKAVYDAICADTDSAAAAELALNGDWITAATVKSGMSKALYKQMLHDGEAEVMALAHEMKSLPEPLLLVIDDAEAKKHAKASSFRVTGTMGILYRAKRERLIEGVKRDIRPLTDNLNEQNIYVGGEVISFFKKKPPKPKKDTVKKPMTKRDKIIVHMLTLAIVVLSVFLAAEMFKLARRQYDLAENRKLHEQFVHRIGWDWLDNITNPQIHIPIPSGEAFEAARQWILDGDDLGHIFFAAPPEPPRQREAMPEILESRREFNNNDVIGLIIIPSEREEGPIVYAPLMQSETPDFYLNHNPSRRRNGGGSIFLDFRNSSMLTDHNNIVYGHNMADRSMFGNLREYGPHGDSDDFMQFAREHRDIYIMTLYDVTVWRIFASYWTLIHEVEGGFYYLDTTFATRQEHQGFLDEVRRRTTLREPYGGNRGGFFFNDVQITPDSTILTLSTCTNIHDDHRHVIHAVLIDRR
jgi:SrtB family sortase